MEIHESNSQSVDQRLLRGYFSSGWAFFMPYLFFYLLYYWRKWPVNPLSGHTLGSGGHIPALLHVYWALHAIHAILGLLALRAWRGRTKAGFSNFSIFRFSDFLPWLLLALIFYIPGAYLEWPSDPWEHLLRINAWHVGQSVDAHPWWGKSSYFLAYSLLGRVFGLQQLFWLDFYYTGICLLLCWQYYRLTRAVGLGERAGLVFVILQAILFGNNVFSFYRYYGISSSIYAQLGAVALTRLGIEVMGRKSENWEIGKSGNSSHKTKFRFPLSSFSYLTSAICPLTSAFCLVLFTAFNHIQGIGLAALGLAAVVTWRLIEWKRSAAWILLALAILLSLAAVRWYPRHPVIDQIYRPQGYLNAWYGFNIFSPSSPAGDRMLQIVGVVGLVNFAAGLLLLRRNHPAGWLTVMPVIALSLPCVAIPFAGALAQHGNEINIVTFQRMLFAIPAGLALVCLAAGMIERRAEKSRGPSSRPFPAFIATVGCLVILTTVPPDRPYYTHFWHALDRTPADLQMHAEVESFKTPPAQPDGKELPLVTTININYVLEAIGIANRTYTPRTIGAPMADSSNGIIERMTNPRSHGSLLYVPPARELYTTASLAGQLSGHWPPQEAASDCAAGPELEAAVLKAGGTEVQESGAILYRW